MATNTIISLRPQNFIRQLPWQLDSKLALMILSALALVSLIAGIYLSQASAVTATTYHIDELRLELNQLQNQNAALILEIAQHESLSRVEKRAFELGFGPTEKVEYITINNYPNLPTDDVATYRGKTPVQGNIDRYVTTEDDTTWWVPLLDIVTNQIEN